MSIQIFEKASMVDGQDGVTPLKYNEYIVRLGVQRQGNGKIVTKDVPFGISGPSTATEAQLRTAGVKMAERIAALSSGVIMNLFEKIGKYRNDELPSVTHDLETRYAIAIQSTDPRVENPTGAGTPPAVVKSARVFIPWKRTDISEQDVQATFREAIVVDAINFDFSVSRFIDETKEAMEVFTMPYNAGVVTKKVQRTRSFQLTNTDSVAGDSDGVSSGAYGDIYSGGDDPA